MLPKAVSHPTSEGPSHIYSNTTFITLSSKSRSLSANDIWRTQVWISSHAAHPSPCLAKNSLRALHYCWPKARLFNPHVASCREAKPSRSAKVGKGRRRRLPRMPPSHLINPYGRGWYTRAFHCHCNLFSSLSIWFLARAGNPISWCKQSDPLQAVSFAPDHVEDLCSFYIYTYTVLATESTSRIPIEHLQTLSPHTPYRVATNKRKKYH